MALKKSKKQIKKKFFPIKIPLLKKEIEVYNTSIKNLDEKRIKLDLTPELKGKALDLKLIVEATEEEAIAKPIEVKLMPSYLRRMMRKGTDYSEDSFIANCKDNKVIIKPFMITRKRVTRKVLKGLREKAKQELTNWAKEKTFEELVSETISGKVQKELLIKLKKIYPLSLCEIKYLAIYTKQEYEESEEKKE